MARRSEQAHSILHRFGRQIDNWDAVELDNAHMTDHARQRSASRGISAEQIQRTIDHGREVHERHATIYFIGDREIAQDKSLSDCDGIHVICSPIGCVVLTAYRNKTFSPKRYFANQRPRTLSLKYRYGK